ncbi:MAG: PIN domain-containing protein [Candidatus Thermoplasmatota archaeon]
MRGPGGPPGAELLAAPSRLIVDANVVVAAFLRSSTVRRILTFSLIDLYVPEFLWDEIGGHRSELERRASLSQGAAAELLELLEGYVTTIPIEALLPHWKRAAEAMRRVDSRDTAYVAAALAVPCDGIWSDDRHLKAQRIVPCWTTRELLTELNAAGVEL